MVGEGQVLTPFTETGCMSEIIFVLKRLSCKYAKLNSERRLKTQRMSSSRPQSSSYGRTEMKSQREKKNLDDLK